MFARRKFLPLVCLVHFMIPALAVAATPEPNTYYRISTEYRGGGTLLDVFNGDPKNNYLHLAPAQDVSGQYWRFVADGNGTFKITTQFRGPDRCLDVANGGDNNNQPYLKECGNFSGQQWMIVPDGPWVRFKTKFTGDDMCLDIINGGPNDNQPYLKPCGNFSGQHWHLAAAKPVVPMTADGKQIVRKLCKWFGTAPICNGQCPAGWQIESNARTQDDANRITWVLPAGGMPSFGEPCGPFTSKALCCHYQ